MVLINYATKEIVAKIVYYGPALCGKTTNLQYIYTKLNPKKRGKMIALATESDRTLFFDFLPMELGKIQGFKVRFQLYTVPGQVFYSATRRLVLKGADAVVFVADSQEELLQMNKDSIEDMKQNLIENNLDPENIPLVIQYNKRDLNGIMEVEDLERELNWRGVPYGESVAITGPGVMESFMEITRALIADLKKKHAFMDTDAIKELPPEIFQDEEPEQEVLEADDVVFEIEHGSGYRHESEDEEVVAGEMLDMIETISLADAARAEEFFDDVRKGVPTEEAKERVLAEPSDVEEIEVSNIEEDAGSPEYLMPGDISITPVGERELTPDEIEFVEEIAEDVAPADIELEAEMPTEVPVEPAPTPEPKAKTAKSGRTKKTETVSTQSEKRIDDMQETLALLAKDVAALSVKLDKMPAAAPGASGGPVQDKRIDVMLDTQTLLAKDIAALDKKLDNLPAAAPGASGKPAQDKRIDAIQDTLALLAKDVSALNAKLDNLPVAAPGAPAGPSQDKRIDAIQDTLAILAKEVSSQSAKLDNLPAAALPAVEGGGPVPDISDIRESLGRIEQEVSAQRLSLTMMKESVSNAVHTAQSGGGAESQAALNELMETLKASFEGQDRLMLSILESARASAQANTSGFEKIEDALRYIAGSVKDEKDGKKKWF